MPTLANKSNCTGCTACESVCPKKAITMVADGMGFKFPDINYNLCIECKLCEKACPIIKPTISHNYDDAQPDSFAVQLKDKNELKKSQSGGAFFAIASNAINNGFLVYGAGVDSNLTVRHMKASNIEELNKLRFSKYVQSDLGNSFKEIKEELKAGNKILFTGTPCQIAGLKGAIPAKYLGNLITVDLICHGVPGPEVYRQYLNFLEQKFKHKIERFIFRDKDSFGWRTPREGAIFSDGTKRNFYYYNYLFLEKDLLARKGCAQCRFCNLQRVSDITIADCWGWEKLQRTDFNENLGISLVLINSNKGKEFFNESSEFLIAKNVPLNPFLLQRNLKQPTKRPELADKIAQEFPIHGFGYINKHYGLNSPRAKLAKLRKLLARLYHHLRK